MTISEFGRRVKENGSNGTDHGTANNVFIIGNNLRTSGIGDIAHLAKYSIIPFDINIDLSFWKTEFSVRPHSN